MKLGNGRYEAHEYRTPGTPTVYKLGIAVGDGSLTRIEYDFHPATNNGNVWKQRIIRPQFSAEQEYGYDALNRISSMYESAAVNRAYDYDRYGNRYVETSSSQIPSPIAPEPTMPGHFNTANNRLAMSGTGFDAAGNQTTLAPYTLEYDAEGRNTVVKLSGASYATFSYDGEGRRVRKAMNGGDTTYYLYDALGQMAVEYSTEPPSSTGPSYLFADMLGSVRTITNDVGAVVECYDYLPFGRMLGSGVGGRGSCYPDPPDANYDSRAPQKFTGKERDAETGLDYFGARYYSGAQGRFITPDPLMASAKISSPQTWNRYSYTLNNPLRFVDPDGLEVPDECVQDPDCQIKVSVNVIYDKNAFRGKGLTDKQKKELEKDQLAKAKKDYGKSNIVLDIKYTEGEFDRNSNQVTGIDANSVNVMAMSTTPRFEKGSSTMDEAGNAIAFIDVDAANSWNSPFSENTTEHELAHVFLGHIYGPRSFLGNLFGDIGINVRLNGQSKFGISQQDMREGLAPRRYAVPMNPEAFKPSNK